MKGNLYVVVGSPISDIGKGWLAGSVASILPSALSIKIDPILTVVDLATSYITRGVNRTADAETLAHLGVPFKPEQLFFQGNVLLEFLEANRLSGVDAKMLPLLTYSDMARFFAVKIERIHSESNKKDLVVEVGGSINDMELGCIPSVLKLVASHAFLSIKILLLSYLDYSEDPRLDQPVKTRNVSFGIEQTRRIYGEPCLVFFRRRNIPVGITKEEMEKLKEHISRRALYGVERIVPLPEVVSPLEERAFIMRLPELRDALCMQNVSGDSYR